MPDACHLNIGVPTAVGLKFYYEIGKYFFRDSIQLEKGNNGNHEKLIGRDAEVK